MPEPQEILTQKLVSRIAQPKRKYTPPPALVALVDYLRLPQPTLADVMEAEMGQPVYQNVISSWLRGTKPMPEKYEKTLRHVLRMTIQAADEIVANPNAHEDAALVTRGEWEQFKTNLERAREVLAAQQELFS